MRHFSRTLKKVGRVVVDLSAGRTAAFMVSCPSACRSHREFIATVVEHFRSLYHFRHHGQLSELLAVAPPYRKRGRLVHLPIILSEQQPKNSHENARKVLKASNLAYRMLLA